ncbi:MAG: hypothetical protein Fur0022_16660 [Anaerolineales bacterium]
MFRLTSFLLSLALLWFFTGCATLPGTLEVAVETPLINTETPSATLTTSALETPQEPTPTETLTPTPEPTLAPTAASMPPPVLLPETCPLTAPNVYTDSTGGYCVAYPETFMVDNLTASEGMVTFYGPAVDTGDTPSRAKLEVIVQPIPPGSTLPAIVGEFVNSFQTQLPQTILRTPATLGNLPAEKLARAPDDPFSYMVLAVQDTRLATLRFFPTDTTLTQPDLEAIFQSVTTSFTFLQVETLKPTLRTLTWQEFDRNIILEYFSNLAPWAYVDTVPTYLLDEKIEYPFSQPPYVEFRFVGFQGGRAYDLPMFYNRSQEAQIMIYRTADFPDFGVDDPRGFSAQFQALTALLETGLDPARCGHVFAGDAPPLPVLPPINAQQTFCSQPEIIEFTGGRGIRFLTQYTQEIAPVLERQIFYTFQGLTDDGQFYIAAFFPIQTGLFPTEPPPCPQCDQANYNPYPDWYDMLSSQLLQLNELSSHQFAPTLSELDDIIQSIFFAIP